MTATDALELRKKQIISGVLDEFRSMGLDSKFIGELTLLAADCHAVRGLLLLWRDCADEPEERDEIIADLYEIVLESWAASANGTKAPAAIDLDDCPFIERIIYELETYKDKLGVLVERAGGVDKLSVATGIPTPHLRRLLTSGEMIRRDVLKRIVEVLGAAAANLAIRPECLR